MAKHDAVARISCQSYPTTGPVTTAEQGRSTHDEAGHDLARSMAAALTGLQLDDPGARAMRTGTTRKYFGPHSWGLSAVLTLSAALFLPQVAAASDRPTTKLVVVLYPQNSDGSPANSLFDHGLRSTFEARSGERIEIYAEFLDLSRPQRAEDRRL